VKLSYTWKEAMIAAITARKPTHALTIAWNCDPRIDRAKRDLKLAHAKIDKKLLGRNYWRFPASERTKALFVFEGVGYNLHAHSFWTVPPPLLIKFNAMFVGERGGMWNTIVRSGTYKLDMIAPGDCARYANYALKTQHADSDVGHIMWSEDFLRAA